MKVCIAFHGSFDWATPDISEPSLMLRHHPGHSLRGPDIVAQMYSTTVIYPGQTAVIDCYRNINISVLDG